MRKILPANTDSSSRFFIPFPKKPNVRITHTTSRVSKESPIIRLIARNLRNRVIGVQRGLTYVQDGANQQHNSAETENRRVMPRNLSNRHFARETLRSYGSILEHVRVRRIVEVETMACGKSAGHLDLGNSRESHSVIAATPKVSKCTMAIVG